MRTIIMTLKDAIDTELRYADKLDKTDKIIFIYPEGKDLISLKVHAALLTLKCKTEFFAYTEQVAVQMAFLVGINQKNLNEIYIVDTTQKFKDMENFGAKIITDLADAIKGIKSVPTKPKAESSNQVKSKADSAEKSVTSSKRRGRPAAASVKDVVTEKDDIKEAKTDTAVKKKTEKKTSNKNESPIMNKMEEFKAFLDTLKTDEYNPADNAFGIHNGIKNAIKQNISVKEGISNALIDKDLISKSEKALVGSYSKLEKMVRESL